MPKQPDPAVRIRAATAAAEEILARVEDVLKATGVGHHLAIGAGEKPQAARHLTKALNALVRKSDDWGRAIRAADVWFVRACQRLRPDSSSAYILTDHHFTLWLLDKVSATAREAMGLADGAGKFSARAVAESFDAVAAALRHWWRYAGRPDPSELLHLVRRESEEVQRFAAGVSSPPARPTSTPRRISDNGCAG
jgi:hypothetical protein